MNDFSPDDYESLTGITKAEYEARVLAGARDWCLEGYPDGSTDATIESVEMQGDSLDTRLVILFRIPSRPECLFGCSREIWPASPWEEDDTPEQTGEWLVISGVGESLEQGGLVGRECVSEGITWLP